MRAGWTTTLEVEDGTLNDLEGLVGVSWMGIPKDFEKVVGVRRAWRPVTIARKAKMRLMALKIEIRGDIV